MRFKTSRAAIVALLTIVLCAAAAAADEGAPAAPRQNALVVAAAKPDAGAEIRTRFVVGLDREVDYDVFSLTNPNRLVVELPDVRLRLPEQSEKNPIGLVKSFRGGLAAPGKARIVIDVTEAVVVESALLEREPTGGYRLAIDFLPFSAALKLGAQKPLGVQPAGLGAAGLQPPLPKRAENPRERALRAFRPVIVLDPGHGGDDTGAMKLGTVEKDVVLAFGKALREHLENTGRYKVLMTRDTDRFVPLDDRLSFGERNKASLFIAIHADYARASARGATIFTLRDGIAKDLERSAKGAASRGVLSNSEVDVVRQASGDVDAVRGILSDLAERDVERTRDRTSVFARSVIDTMGESTPMRDDPDQQATFRVLKTAQFPSVLIELAYVTNQQDASNLKSDEWRDKVAESIVSAIDNYFSNQVARLPM